MKVGIVGSGDRASAWEKHLRPLAAVHEVIISSSPGQIGEMNACILIDESSSNLQILSDLTRLGIHTYLIAPVPFDEPQLKKICALSQESDTRIQFSHWPVLSPSTQWMKSKLPGPQFLQIVREQSNLALTENRNRFGRYWMDEIGWIMKWLDSGLHRIEAHEVISGFPEAGIRVFIKFENGATASLFHLTAGETDHHHRIASGSGILLDCNVDSQMVRLVQKDDTGRLASTSRSFDATRSAELSAVLFFKAIRLKTHTAFSPFDALRTSAAIRRISSVLKL